MISKRWQAAILAVGLSVNVFFVGQLARADWQGPTAAPPNENRPGYIYNNQTGSPQADAGFNISGGGNVGGGLVTGGALVGSGGFFASAGNGGSGIQLLLGPLPSLSNVPGGDALGDICSLIPELCSDGLIAYAGGIGSSNRIFALNADGELGVSGGVTTFMNGVNAPGTIKATRFCLDDSEANCISGDWSSTAGSSWWAETSPGSGTIQNTNGIAGSVQVSNAGEIVMQRSGSNSAQIRTVDGANNIAVGIAASGAYDIYVPGNKPIIAYTGTGTSASERLRITPAGNVGVNANAPTSTLTVGGSVGLTGSLSVGTNLNAGDSGQCLISAGAGAAPTWGACGSGGSGAIPTGTSGQTLRYAADGTTVTANSIIFNNGTNVGIGLVTAAAPAEARLHVVNGSAGTVTANANSVVVAENNANAYVSVLTPTTNERGVLFGEPGQPADGGIIYNNASTLDGLQFRTNGNATRAVVTSGGNFGIGTLAPQRALEIGNDVSGLSVERTGTSPHAAALRFGDNSGWKLYIGRSRESIGGALNANAAGALMTIQDNGNIGIGTTAPAQDLHLSGTTDTRLRVEATAAGSASQIELIRQGQTSYVGPNAAGNFDLSLASTTMPLTISTGGVERMRILNTGDIGIGTATPQYPFHVVTGSGGAVFQDIYSTSGTVGSGVTFGRNGNGIRGYANGTSVAAVSGVSQAPDNPSSGTLDNVGVQGEANGNGSGGVRNYGGKFIGNVGALGRGKIGVYGVSGATSVAGSDTVSAPAALLSGSTSYAGYFNGNLAVTGALMVGTTPGAGTAGQVLVSAGAGVPPVWTTDQWTTSGTNIASVNTGNVGIGTAAASAADKLDVNGDVRVGTSGTNGCLKNNNGGTITGTCSSDARLKQNIQPIIGVLDGITALQPVWFDWKSTNPAGYAQSGSEFGLIAQDVAQVFPELVSIDDHGYGQVKYQYLPILTIEAIKEQQKQIEDLQEQVNVLQATVQKLLQR